MDKMTPEEMQQLQNKSTLFGAIAGLGCQMVVLIPIAIAALFVFYILIIAK